MVGYVFIADVPLDEFDADLSDRDLALGFLEDQLSVSAVHVVQGDSNLNAEAILAPLLDRHGAETVGQYRDDQGGRYYEIHMLALTDHERDLSALYALGKEAQALLDAAVGEGHLTASSVRDLLAAGYSGTLLGQVEADWIDAKEIPHRTDTDTSSFELAKDVAAFANTGQDAVIVYGIATKGGTSGDMLDRLRPFELTSLDIPALSNALGDRLVPVLTDLEIGSIEAREGTEYGFGWIFIPAQPPWIRPVLVRGASSMAVSAARISACRSERASTPGTGMPRQPTPLSKPGGLPCKGTMRQAGRELVLPAASRPHFHHVRGPILSLPG